MQSSITAWLHKQPKSELNTTSNLKQQGADSTKSVSLVHPAGSDQSANDTQPAPLRLQPPFGPGHALPTAAAIVPCTLSNLEGFRRLNALLLPIPYPEKFYDETINDAETASITKLAVWQAEATNDQKQQTAQPKVVAAIRCRILRGSESIKSEPVLYISTIGTLAAYREHGLATHLLAQVTQVGLEKHGTRSVMAHVWEDNEDALDWYRRRGFVVKQRSDGYYRRLAPRSAAFVMIKDILPSDILHEKSIA